MSSFSCEEKDELARSKKKVKDVNHAGFSEEPNFIPSSPSYGLASGKQDMSLKS